MDREDRQQAIRAGGPAAAEHATGRRDSSTVAVAWAVARFLPVSVAGTFRLLAVELPAETIRAENRKLLGLPLTSASRSQHRRPAPAIAPGAAITRSVLGTDTHILGITPGDDRSAAHGAHCPLGVRRVRRSRSPRCVGAEAVPRTLNDRGSY